MWNRIFISLVIAIFLAQLITPTGLAGVDDPSAPTSPVKLVFVHHSTGGYWLADEHGQLGNELMNNNYFVSDTDYGWGPGAIGDRTDIGNWYNWFGNGRSSTVLTALFTESEQNSGFGYYSRIASDPGGENEIIVFKSCYPNSALGGNVSDPIPLIGSNPLRGQSAYSEYHTISNAKGIYLNLLSYFQTKPDKLFVVITAPPLSDGTYAANARAFNTWLVDKENGWLKDYSLLNVAVFDFYNVLTTNGGDPDTNDLNQVTGNHHRWWNNAVQEKTDGGSNVLAYPTGDDHPSAAGDQKASKEFVPLLNIFYHRWKNGSNVTPTPIVSTSTSTPILPTSTNTPIPPTLIPTATNTPISPTLIPTAINTPIPPTLIPTATNTLIPPTLIPTAINTPIPPTLIPTAINTPVLPTATDSPIPTSTPLISATNTPTPTRTQLATAIPTNTPTSSGCPNLSAGYCRTDSESRAWIAGTTNTGITLDEQYKTLTLPFTFTFFGTRYSKIKVSSNGIAYFGTVAEDYDNVAIPNTNPPNMMIAALWDDLDPSSGGRIYTNVSGATPNRVYTIEWRDVHNFELGTTGASFEIQLTETTNEIWILYKDLTFGDVTVDNGLSSTVGIENAGSAGNAYSFNQAVLTVNKALHFYK